MMLCKFCQIPVPNGPVYDTIIEEMSVDITETVCVRCHRERAGSEAALIWSIFGCLSCLSCMAM
jgi:late competence protein required for DNA uptake (superfamily II DNA/RNA helicase)